MNYLFYFLSVYSVRQYCQRCCKSNQEMKLDSIEMDQDMNVREDCV